MKKDKHNIQPPTKEDLPTEEEMAEFTKKVEEFRAALEEEAKRVADDPETKAAIDQMKKQQEFTKKLVERVLDGAHMEWQFIHDLNELKAAKFIVKANLSVAQNFKKSYDRCMAEYLDLVGKQFNNIDMIVSAKQIKRCYEFYTKEAEIAKDMIKEFRNYVYYGHIFNTLILNIYRPEEDEVDWRTLPVSWNPFKK